MPDLDLFDKTELWLVGIRFSDARLSAVAEAAAAALSLAPDDVFVTDVRDDHVVFDILAPRIAMSEVLGRESALLDAVGAVAGVELLPGARVHSRGVLGMLGAPVEQVDTILDAATALEDNLRAYVARRVAVVSTGPEVIGGHIRDTNFEAAVELLTAHGFEVASGGAVGDDERAIAGRVARLCEDGYGVIITTGGVGAEDKDRTIEALQLLVPDLSTAVLATYEVGHGRHVKPHVRVAVGRLDDVVIVALPGPTREVRAALPVLVELLAARQGPAAMAESIASSIRALWQRHDAHHSHDAHRSNDGEA